MEEDEMASVVCRGESMSDVSNQRNGFASSSSPSSSLQAITTKALKIAAILQGITSKTIAFIAIASNTINAAIAASQSSGGNDMDAFVASDTDADYLLDSIDKRIYRNFSINTPIVKSVTVNSSDSDNSENVTMASLGNNLLAAAVTSTFNTIKSNDTVGYIASSVGGGVNMSTITEIDVESTPSPMIDDQNNYWALSALILVLGTAAGNILVCLAITWERRLQNVTNYFLMSLAITDLMVAILVMPLGILSLVKGE